jgi:predicted Rossmann fold flavoprotein
MTERWDAIVVGGGAAGFFGAITCASQTESRRVLLLESGRRVLQKVKISGGGRCNVTHACFDPKVLATHYPRGEKALIGPLHRFGVTDTIEWFAAHGVELKTEADGRMFPTTDDSSTIVECLNHAARKSGVRVRTRSRVRAISPGFTLTLESGEELLAPRILLATGGTRSASGAALAESLGHDLSPAVPSLFTFHVEDSRIRDLQGLSVEHVHASIPTANLTRLGPLLITHRGFSGPAILKLSAWGARHLFDLGYHFELRLNWLPEVDLSEQFARLRHHSGARRVAAHSPFEALPRRLWQRLVQAAQIPSELQWASLSSVFERALTQELTDSSFAVRGKSTHKEEFVTCGGVPTDQVDMRTMESRRQPGLFLAGELLDIDGVTGGFNFQNAWTTGYLAGVAMAS